MEIREGSLLCPESSVPELASVLGVCERGLGLGSPSWWNQSWFYNPF